MTPTYGTRRAINELLGIFSCQWRNCMLPQIRFMTGQQGYRPDPDDWGVTPEISGPTRLRTSGITQPPIIGMCAYEVFLKIGEEARRAHHADFLAMADGLERYHAWLLSERDTWGEHLAMCLHPWETGTDNSPAFDPLIESTRAYIAEQGIPVDTFGRADTVHVKAEHRPTGRDYIAYFGLLSLFKSVGYDQRAIIERSPFLLQDVLFNSLLVVSLQSLALLQTNLAGLDAPINEAAREGLVEKAARNSELAETVATAMRNKLWSEGDGLFYSYDSRDRRLLPTPTVSSLMPLMGGIARPEQAARLIEHLANPSEFWTEVPVPSTAANSQPFNPQRYWSGPSWPVTNWLVLRGLHERGSPLAEELRTRTLEMISEGASEDTLRHAAMGVLERNSFGEDLTTPSKQQYAHGWLWDSAIVALSWPAVASRPELYTPQPGQPGFWEYYHPRTGEPLGAPLMSWTASLAIELQDLGAAE
jgi:hypothetical protein